LSPTANDSLYANPGVIQTALFQTHLKSASKIQIRRTKANVYQSLHTNGIKALQSAIRWKSKTQTEEIWTWSPHGMPANWAYIKLVGSSNTPSNHDRATKMGEKLIRRIQQ